MSIVNVLWRAFRTRNYLSRFVQPDSIIPDPVNPQAWNRYSYVSNRPVNFNDPSGHCYVGDDDTDNCHTPSKKLPKISGDGTSGGGGSGSGDDVHLTTYPEDCDLVAWNGYCRTGDQMEDLYNLYKDTDGWWNSSGKNFFSPVDFLALMTYYELQEMTTDPVAVDLAWQIMARKMQWLCRHIGSSCDGDVIPANAIFNYVATRESAGDRYTAYFINGSNLHTYNEYTYSYGTARYIAGKAVFDANSANPNLGGLPDWGNASMFAASARQELSAAEIGWCQTCVLYSFQGSDPAYFMTSDQINYFYGR